MRERWGRGVGHVVLFCGPERGEGSGVGLLEERLSGLMGACDYGFPAVAYSLAAQESVEVKMQDDFEDDVRQ